MKPYGFRLEWKAGEYAFYSPEMFDLELYKDGARIWGLYTIPQENCSTLIVVFHGKWWVQPKYVNGQSLDGFIPLYLGPLIFEPEHQYDMSKMH